MRALTPLSLSVALTVLAACNKPTQGEAIPPASSSASPTASSLASPTATGSNTAASASDTLETSAGKVTIHPVMHATLWLEFGGKTIVIDPWSKAGAKLDAAPKADFVFITDIHQDHFDPAGIEHVKKASTVFVVPKVVAEKLPGAVVMANGEKKDFAGFSAEAIPMYNLSRGPEAGKLFHDKGRGNGYILTFGDKRLYLSGDTECVPEIKALQNIDVAFLCMNLPYTMPPSEAGECVRAFKPKVLYPYHYRESDPKEMGSLPGVEVRQRNWY